MISCNDITCKTKLTPFDVTQSMSSLCVINSQLNEEKIQFYQDTIHHYYLPRNSCWELDLDEKQILTPMFKSYFNENILLPKWNRPIKYWTWMDVMNVIYKRKSLSYTRL